MAKEKESTTKLKLDATDFKRGINDANRAIRLANSEFKSATSSLDDWRKSTEGLEAKQKQLQTVLDAEKKKLEILKEQYLKVKSAQGANSAEAENLKIKMNNQQAAVNRVDAQLKSYTEELKSAKAGNKDLSESEKKTEEQTAALNDKFNASKVALGNLISDGLEKGAQKFMELADAAKQAYQELDEGADNVIKATGATGEAADRLTTSYENVARNVRGDFADLGSLVGEVSTRFGYADEKLEKAATTFQKFADITGGDGKTAVQLTAQALEKSGKELDKYEELLDKVAYSSQATGIESTKLLSLLVDNGAAFKQLNLDLDSQISLLAILEKGGVNVSSALSGMKKAVGNWSKEGKNANIEFDRTLKLIQQAPDATEAAKVAVEAFGAKSGVELADAMRTGKFSYEEFAQSLKKSSKTVEKTYENTQDSLDKIDLAMQGVKVDVAKAFGELLEENKENIDEAIEYFKTTVIPGAKRVVTWTIDNFDKIKSVAKGVATTLATVWVIKKSAQFAQTVTGFVGMLKNLSGAADSAAKSQESLNAAQSASPIGAIATTVGLLIGAMTTLIDLAADDIQVVEEETDKYQDLHDEISKTRDEWKELEATKKELIDKSDAEFDYYQKLKTELDLITDKNGKVREGYEDRAKFITEKLSEATGIEIKLNDGIIESYDKVSKAIDDVLKKKRSQAVLNANEESYQKAVTENEKQYNHFIEAKEAWEESAQEVDLLKSAMTQANLQYNVQRKAGNNVEAENWFKRYQEAEAELKKAENQKSKNWTSYNEAKVNYETTASTMQNYEELSAALLGGDEKAISRATENLKKGFMRAETTTKNSLEQQVKSYKKYYENLEKQLEKGTPGVTKVMVEQAKEMSQAAVNELEKYNKNYSQAGKLNMGAYAGGMTSTDSKSALLEGAYTTTLLVSNEFTKNTPSFLKSGKNSVENYAKGLISGKDSYLPSAMSSISQKTSEALAKDANKAKTYGQNFAKNYFNAIKSFAAGGEFTTIQSELAKATQSLATTQFMEQLKKLYGVTPNNSTTIINNFTQNNNSPKAISAYDASRYFQAGISKLKL